MKAASAFHRARIKSFFPEAKVDKEIPRARMEDLLADFPSNYTFGAPKMSPAGTTWQAAGCSQLPLYGETRLRRRKLANRRRKDSLVGGGRRP